MSKVEDKLKEMGLALPPVSPIRTVQPAVRTGNLVFLSGATPKTADGKPLAGKVGRDLTVEQGYEGARQVALILLANLKREIGDLDRVKRVVKVLGLVHSDPAFTQPPAVVNGFSDLIVEAFGDKGRHARSAVGIEALPAAVEVEMIVEVEE